MLEAKNLSFGFGDRLLLESIDLVCRRGETVGIVGKSGSGKTSLLNLIAGYLHPNKGNIKIENEDPQTAARHQQIGYVFQSATLLPFLTVEQNTAVPLQLRAHSKQNNNLAKTVYRAMERTHIVHAADKYPHELSGGMQARAAIARAIVYRPKLLLFDEPMAGLDDVLKENFIYPELQELLKEEKVATVLVTHNLNEAILLCDKVHVLRANNGNGPSRFVHSEDVRFDRPRTTDLYENSQFMAARRRLREHLS